MTHLSRRDFIKRSAGVVATGVAVSGVAGAEEAVVAAPKAVGMRPLGMTGLTATLLGIGTGTHAWNGVSDQNKQGHEAFVRTLTHAYDRGLRFYDLADMYGSHSYVRDAMKAASMDRSRMLILSKSVAKDAETMRADLDRFRKELDTDYVDVLLLHCMTKRDWTEVMKPCMDVLSEAKEKGQIRAHGVSCHSIGALKTAAASPWVDVMLSRINPFGVKMDAPPDKVVSVLKEAHAAGKGMLGMKILGEGTKADQIEESLRFVLPLGCVDAITIGFLTPEEIDVAIENIERVA